MSEITPALTAEEWQRYQQHDQDGRIGQRMGLNLQDRVQSLSALCLHGQPFGFTRDDVETLRQVAPFIVGSSRTFPDLRAWAHGLADRIAALLPPEPAP